MPKEYGLGICLDQITEGMTFQPCQPSSCYQGEHPVSHGNLYNPEGQLKPDAKFVYIDCDDFKGNNIELLLDEGEGAIDEDNRRVMVYACTTPEMR